MKEQLNITMLCAVLALSGACLGGCGMQGGFVGEPSDTTARRINIMDEDAEGDNDSKAEESQTAAPFNLDGVIEQTVLLDDDALTIVAEKLEYRNDMAYLTLSITNNTEGELDVMTSTLGYSANYGRSSECAAPSWGNNGGGDWLFPLGIAAVRDEGHRGAWIRCSRG